MYPKVSIIVPCHKATYGLARCLRALSNQDYPGAIEILVANDGGGSAVSQVCAEFGVVECAVPNPGSSYRARNEALLIATGDYIAFTDSNKIATQGWIAAGVTVLEGSKAGYLSGPINIVPSSTRGRDWSYWLEHYQAFPATRYYEKYHFGVTGNLMVRASIVQRFGGFDGSLVSGGDFEWGRRLYEFGVQQVFSNDFIVAYEARSLREILRKTKRVCISAAAQGSGDAKGQTPSLKNILRGFLPPKKIQLKPLSRSASRLSVRLRVLLLLWFVGIYRSFVMIRTLGSRQLDIRFLYR